MPYQLVIRLDLEAAVNTRWALIQLSAFNAENRACKRDTDVSRSQGIATNSLASESDHVFSWISNQFHEILVQ